MRPHRFVLVHAPVVGPGSWIPVARALAGLGHEAVVPDLTSFADGGPPYAARLIEVFGAELADELAGEPADVLAVHSGGGIFAPHLADACDAACVIFADATLPPRSGPAAVMDREFLPFVRNIAAGGVVPPWPDWWPAEVMAAVVPDEPTRRRVMAEARPLPLAFFEEGLPPTPASWPGRRCGYLRFSDDYAGLAREAATRGWPVRDLPGEHLHMVVEPAEVAAALLGLASVS